MIKSKFLTGAFTAYADWMKLIVGALFISTWLEALVASRLLWHRANVLPQRADSGLRRYLANRRGASFDLALVALRLVVFAMTARPVRNVGALIIHADLIDC